MRSNNKGMTLVEVVAGFLLLAVLMTSFVKIVNLSAELAKSAKEVKDYSTEFEKRYYNGENYEVTYNKKTELAFRKNENAIVYNKDAIILTEWHIISSGDNKGDFYEYQKDTNGEYPKTEKKSSEVGFTDNNIKLPDTKLVKIENVFDSEMKKLIVYRYLTEKQ